MKFSDKYNIDALLRTKSFAELNNSEKAFVLELLVSKEAYIEMREVLLRAEKSLKTDSLKAPANLRADLLDAYDAQHSSDKGKVFTIWPSGKPWHHQNLVRIGIAAALIGMIWFVYPLSETQNDQLAERKEKPVQNKDEPKPAESTLESDTITEKEVKSEESEIIEHNDKPVPQESDKIVEVPHLEDLDANENIQIKSLSHQTDERASEDMEIAEESSYLNDFAQSDQLEETTSVRSYSNAEGAAPSASRLDQESLAKRKQEDAPPPFRLSDQQNWSDDHYTAW